MQFPEFVAFQARRSGPAPDGQTPTKAPSGQALPEAPPAESVPERDANPEEAIQAAYDKLNKALAQEIIERVRAMSDGAFERLGVQLMLRLDYGFDSEKSGRVLGKPGDEGVDGVIIQDKLGLERIYLQTKRWNDQPVSRKEIQSFAGALGGQGASKGVFVTASTFSPGAADYARKVHGVKDFTRGWSATGRTDDRA